MQIDFFYFFVFLNTVFFFLFLIFAKLKQFLLFCGWSSKLNNNSCDEVFTEVLFGQHIGQSLPGSDRRGTGRKANILLYCI